MITAQDIQEKTFTKSFNGYTMSQVDEFLDEIAADISAMSKENAALNAKLRVLVEKIEEYRQTEDSMRLALLSAQKMGAQVESEAQEKADAIVAQARETANRLTRHATQGIANEEAKLDEAKKATTRFIEHMRLVCEKQLSFYEKLGSMDLVSSPDAAQAAAAMPAQTAPAPAAEPEPAPEHSPEPAPEPAPEPKRENGVDEAVRSIEDSVQKAALEDPEEPVVIDTGLPETEADDESTRRFEGKKKNKKRRYDDFRFGDEM